LSTLLLKITYKISVCIFYCTLIVSGNHIVPLFENGADGLAIYFYRKALVEISKRGSISLPLTVHTFVK